MKGPSIASVGALTDIDSAARNPLGTVQVRDGAEYIYLKGSASIVAKAFVTYDEAFLATIADTDVAASVLGPGAVALAAVVADKYGWFQISGSASVLAATVVDNTKAFVSATAGTLDDTGTAGLQVIGAVFRSADAAGSATIQLFRPHVGVNVA